ncbi:MAG TPA: SDR family NAD(P)-dependent oxidoreductase, partial [Oculatellaceae cyanobacterium]
AKHGAHVYLCARSIAKGNKAIEEMKSASPRAHITLLQMDHLDLSSIVAAAKLVLSKETALHGLINNAGIMATPFEISKDGHETQWQTNYLAHWVFTHHLIPLMLKTSKTLAPGSVRIVNLSSSGHYSAPKGGINFDDLSLSNSNGMPRYGQSKLANILHAKTLHKLYGPGSVTSKANEGEIWTSIVHPGLVESRIGDKAQVPSVLRFLFDVYGAMGGRWSADKGSWTSLYCAASPEMAKDQSGTYFQRLAEPGWQSALAKDEELADRLERWTVEVMTRERWISSDAVV